MVKKTIAKKGAKEIAKKVKPKPKPKQRIAQGNQPPNRVGTTQNPANKNITKTTPKKTGLKNTTPGKTGIKKSTPRPGKISSGSKAKPVQPNKVNPGLAGATGAATAVGVGVAVGKNKGESFDDAFRKARAKGEGTLFTHNGKKYTAVTKDDLKKKGYSTLAEYNRAGGKKKIVPAPNKTELTRKQKRKQRRKERIGFETFKERRQARRAARKMKSGGVVSAKRSTPRGVGAAKRGFGKALKG